LFVCFLVFQFQLTYMMTGVSHGKKLRLSNLIVSLSGHANDWLWGPVNDYGLSPSLSLGTITSVMGSFVPCKRDGMRTPAASICLLGR